ncbi:hypothetical protein ES703_72564 [subsurface metagenome]
MFERERDEAVRAVVEVLEQVALDGRGPVVRAGTAEAVMTRFGDALEDAGVGTRSEHEEASTAPGERLAAGVRDHGPGHGIVNATAVGLPAGVAERHVDVDGVIPFTASSRRFGILRRTFRRMNLSRGRSGVAA